MDTVFSWPFSYRDPDLEEMYVQIAFEPSFGTEFNFSHLVRTAEYKA